MTHYWQQKLPSQFQHEDVPAPLNDPSEKLARDPRHPDHQPVDWRNMLGGKNDYEKSIPLDLLRSENQFLKSYNPPRVHVRRTWDVDSFIARVTSLAAFRDGFILSFSPSYLRTMTQSLRVLINGRSVHKCKHLLLGHGKRASNEFHCYVIFPRMPVGHDGHLYLAQTVQKRWLDRLVIPAIEAHCPSHVLQHLPATFADVATKSWVKKEAADKSHDAAINIFHHIQERYCRQLWDKIVALASAPDLPEFHSLFLIVVHHDLKYSTKSNNARDCRQDFVASLQSCFHWTTDFFPSEDCWVDFGMEDTPVAHPDSPPVTLLRKTQCLKAWKDHFDCPSQAQNLTVSQDYNWSLTKDAGSTSIELKHNNILRRYGQIAYNKAYNIHKTLFTTPIKGLQPFSNPQFEALAFSQDTMSRWYRANSLGTEFSASKKRQALLRSYFATKRRVTTALRAHQRRCYGVRQEYRIRWDLFEALQLDPHEHEELIGEETPEHAVRFHW